ncbi:hypothetical protein [Streptomyces sp. NPDC005181]|uniref:hypothetical protein n=1 Tax=Streptomyces sp. NPDC005181 TaxID=3156869 RepID=UPI0033B41025
MKRRQAGDGPALYATSIVLIGESTVVEAHIRELVGRLREFAGGMRGGQFAPGGPAVAAQAAFDVTARLHDPAYAGSWQNPAVAAGSTAVSDLLLHGLRA